MFLESQVKINILIAAAIQFALGMSSLLAANKEGVEFSVVDNCETTLDVKKTSAQAKVLNVAVTVSDLESSTLNAHFLQNALQLVVAQKLQQAEALQLVERITGGLPLDWLIVKELQQNDVLSQGILSRLTSQEIGILLAPLDQIRLKEFEILEDLEISETSEGEFEKLHGLDQLRLNLLLFSNRQSVLVGSAFISVRREGLRLFLNIKGYLQL